MNRTILITLTLAISVLMCISCSKERIPQKEMSKIIAEIYKADRYININYQLVLKADTVMIYEAVFNKYGYTHIDYINTINHYIGRPNKLKEIFVNAKLILEEQNRVVEEKLERQRQLNEYLALFKEVLDRKDSTNLNSNHRALLLFHRFSDSLSLIKPNIFEQYRAKDSLSNLNIEVLLEKYITAHDIERKSPIFKIDYEKNSRTIPRSTKLLQPDTERGIDFR